MAYARVLSVGLVGVDGHLVEVEADLSRGLPGLVVSGLPDAAVSEARDRVRAAILNSGASWPSRRITVNLLPASLPKHGSGFDIAVAAAVLCADQAVPEAALRGVALFGELGLDGQVRSVRGVLPAVLAAARAGVARVVVPIANAREAALVPGVHVAGVDTLRRLLAFLRGEAELADPPAQPDPLPDPTRDLSDVVGQERGRRALEVAAAGGHNLAYFGPPGAGKTMLAERLSSILPTLDDTEALEVTAVHSVAGVLAPGAPLLRRPPYQAPHHTATVAALVGGGSTLARPGALSLAHRGVLFLDEAPEFSPAVLDALREPLEHGEVRIARSGGITRYPAQVQLVIAANPCPCASAAGDESCTCTRLARRRYLGRLSGPLLDRVDLQVELLPVRAAALVTELVSQERSALVARRVAEARAAAAARWATAATRAIGSPLTALAMVGADGLVVPAHSSAATAPVSVAVGPPGGSTPEPPRWRTNASVPGHVLRTPPWRLPREVSWPVERAVDQGVLSARGFDRVLRAAWTLADLAGRDRPDLGDVSEAIELRLRRAG